MKNIIFSLIMVLPIFLPTDGMDPKKFSTPPVERKKGKIEYLVEAVRRRVSLEGSPSRSRRSQSAIHTSPTNMSPLVQRCSHPLRTQQQLETWYKERLQQYQQELTEAILNEPSSAEKEKQLAKAEQQLKQVIRDGGKMYVPGIFNRVIDPAKRLDYFSSMEAIDKKWIQNVRKASDKYLAIKNRRTQTAIRASIAKLETDFEAAQKNIAKTQEEEPIDPSLVGLVNLLESQQLQRVAVLSMPHTLSSVRVEENASGSTSPVREIRRSKSLKDLKGKGDIIPPLAFVSTQQEKGKGPEESPCRTCAPEKGSPIKNSLSTPNLDRILRCSPHRSPHSECSQGDDIQQ